MKKFAHAEVTEISISMKVRVLELSKLLEELDIEHQTHYKSISVNGVKYQGDRQLNLLAQLIEQGALQSDSMKDYKKSNKEEIHNIVDYNENLSLYEQELMESNIYEYC